MKRFLIWILCLCVALAVTVSLTRGTGGPNLRVEVTTAPLEVRSEGISGGMNSPSRFAIVPESEPEGREPQELNWFKLRSVGKQGAPVEGVKFWASLPEGMRICLGTSDSQGEALVNREGLSGRNVVAMLNGMASLMKTLPPELRGSETFVMRIGGALHGQVMTHDGQSAGEGVGVIARPQFRTRSVENIWDTSLWSSLPAFAKTDEDGHFSITDLDPSMSYFLSSGGNGLASLAEIGPLLLDGIFHEVVVHQVYGAVVDVNDDFSELYWGSTRTDFKYESVLLPEHIVRIDEFRPGLRLAGIPGALNKRDNHLLLLFADARPNSTPELLGPVEYELRMPGFWPSSVQITAAQIQNELPRFGLDLILRETGLGELVVLSDGFPKVGNNQGAYEELATLTLTLSIQDSPIGRAVQYKFSLPGVGKGPVYLQGIPFGDYSARIRFRNGNYTWPPSAAMPIEIGPTRQEIVFDISDSTGSILIEATNEDGSRYDGELLVDLGEGEPVYDADGSVSVILGAGSILLKGSPHRIVGLLPGTYSVNIQRPVQQLEMHIVTVAIGEPTVVFVRLNQY